MTTIMILGVVAGIAAAISAWIQYKENNKQEKETEKYRKKSEELQEKIIELTTENKNLTHELFMYSTGGDSYCYIDLHEVDAGRNNELYIVVHNDGRYPLRNVVAKLTDQNNREMNYKSALFENVIDFGDIPANSSVPTLNKIVVNSNLDMLRLLVQFSSDNTHILQVIRMKKINDKWCRATRVRRFVAGNSEILHEEIDDCLKNYENLFE